MVGEGGEGAEGGGGGDYVGGDKDVGEAVAVGGLEMVDVKVWMERV